MSQEGETQKLIPNAEDKDYTAITTEVYEGKSSIFASSINLLNSIIGAGVLTLPYSLNETGYALGTIFFIMTSFLTHMTFKYLAIAAEYTGVFAYRDIACKLFKHEAWGWVMTIFIIVYVSGSLTSYSIALTDNMFWWMTGNYKEHLMERSLLAFAIMAFCIFPISILKNLDFMKWTGYVVVLCEVYIAGVIAYFFSVHEDPLKAEPVAWKFSVATISTLPLFQVSMCGHFSTTFLYRELKSRSQSKFNIVIILNALVLIFLYNLIMYFGYFTFTDQIHSDVLKTIAILAKDKVYLQLANIAMIFLVICHYPATCYGARMAFESIFWRDGRTPMWGTCVIVGGIILTFTILGIFVTEIGQVLDVTSSLAGSFIILILPAAMMFVINRETKQHWVHQILPCCAMALGSINFVFGISSTIYGFVV